MRFLDIAVGSGYGAICLSLIVLMSPIASRETAGAAVSQAELDGAISSYIRQVGLPFLSNSPLATICESAAAHSNVTLILGAVGCASPEHTSLALASSSLTLDLPGRVLVIEAWLARR